MGSVQALSEADRRVVAEWAADCAERVLAVFESEAPHDGRPRDAIERARAFARGELSAAGEIRRRFVANRAAQVVETPAAKAAAWAAGQAAGVAHMGAHALGAAAYAAKAAALSSAPAGVPATDTDACVQATQTDARGSAAQTDARGVATETDAGGSAAPADAAQAAAADAAQAAAAAEIAWQLGHMSEAVRTALRQLPFLGTDSSGPLGAGLLASGALGATIRTLQTALGTDATPERR